MQFFFAFLPYISSFPVILRFFRPFLFQPYHPFPSNSGLDIIYENLSFDFVSVFNPGGASDLLRNSIIGDKENYASSYNSINKIAQKVLDDFVDAVATLD